MPEKGYAEDSNGASPCVFCLGNGHLRAQQILWQGRACYLCAPRGQLVEGYLAVAPFRCVGSVAAFTVEELSECAHICQMIERFYHQSYGVEEWTFYEQARGGGGKRIDPVSRFPLHAHLCSVPRYVPLHAFLSRSYSTMCIADLGDLAIRTAASPYVYVMTRRGEVRVRRLYQACDAREREQIESMRLKPVLAELLGLAGRADWRAYPGDHERGRLIERFRAFAASRQARDPGRHSLDP